MNNAPDWNRTLMAWLSGEDQMSNPPDWALEMAFEQASSKQPAGSRDAALALLQMLKSCVLEEGEMRLTPKAREILGSMLAAILEGTKPAKAMFLEAKSGHTIWINWKRNNEIIVAMGVRVDAGMKPAPAAREVAKPQEFKDPKTGKPLSAKTINNIWLEYERNPYLRLTFAPPKVPD